MNLIKTLMGRRQFLIASGLASTCALTCKKIAGFVDPNLQAKAAMAADKAATAAVKDAINKCPHLLSTLKIRNVVLKNRILHTPSPPHQMQGPENFPTDAYRNHYSNMAKNAAIVTVDMCYGSYPKNYVTTGTYHGSDHFSDSNWEDIPPVNNYVQRLIEDIHCEGSLVHYIGQVGGSGGAPSFATVQSTTSTETAAGGAGGPQSGGQGGSPQGMQAGGQGSAPQGMQGGGQGSAPQGMQAGGQGGRQTLKTEDVVAQAKLIEAVGFDVMTISGNNPEQVEAVRNATNLVLLVKLGVGGGSMGMGSSRNRNQEYKWNYNGIEYDWQFGDRTPGVTNINQPSEDEIEQAVTAAKKLEGVADILWIRDGRMEHPNSFIQDKDRPFNLAYARAIKKAGIKTIVCPTAGFHDPARNEQFIANNETDMVGMTTPFFADPELIKKVYEGRLDDIVPCLMCQDCHGISRKNPAGPWFGSCNVNPKWAVPVYKIQNIPAPTLTKKVAVIGGGPAGMKAAITAAERGHRVTLYEKSESLGGLLKFTDYTQWKWTYKDFKDYLIHQVDKHGIDIKLNATATPEMIKSKGYDTVLVATGAEPIISKMAGADAKSVFNILSVYSNKKDLGKDVVMIGGGRIGTEAAIGIAKDGHKVTVIVAGKDLIETEVIGAHNMMNQIGILQNHPNFNCVFEANVRSISGGKVTYTDAKGNEGSIPADSIVIYSGFKPTTDEAVKFDGTAGQVFLLGDCTGKNGTIQKAIRSAFFMASQV